MYDELHTFTDGDYAKRNDIVLNIVKKKMKKGPIIIIDDMEGFKTG